VVTERTCKFANCVDIFAFSSPRFLIDCFACTRRVRCVGLWLGANHFISSTCGAVRSMVKPSAYRILAGDAEYVVEKVDSQAGAGGAVFSVYHTTQSPTVSANLMPIVMASSDPADALDVTTAAILGNTCGKCVSGHQHYLSVLSIKCLWVLSSFPLQMGVSRPSG